MYSLKCANAKTKPLKTNGTKDFEALDGLVFWVRAYLDVVGELVVWLNNETN